MNCPIVVALLLVYVLGVVHGQSDVGGTAAPDGKYPYQAALFRKKRFVCGASVINERWLLTAAHCFDRFTSLDAKSNATVMVGTNQLTAGNGVRYNVELLLPHEDYDKDFIHANDIALIRVSGKIKFTSKVQPIKLPKNNLEVYENVTTVLTGWGSFENKSVPPRDLQHVALHVINHDRCAEAWKKSRNRIVLDSQICTSGKIEENLATHGDSGGPLVADGVQIGVVSYAWKDLPDVFSKVSAFLPWIRSRAFLK